MEQASEKDEELVAPIFKNGVYDNPWDTWHKAGFFDLMKWSMFGKNNTNLPCDLKELDHTLPVHQVTAEEIEKFCSEDTTDATKVIWIGHATTLVNMNNCVIMMDPVFSERCSPSQIAGPKRFRPVPIQIEKIPRVDAVIISHNHYDHLDHASVLSLNKKFGTNLNWFVGMGTAEWFRSCGINENVHELNWWDSKEYKNIKFVFTPSQHWCARGIADRNKCLWGSWTVIGPKRRFFFGGDTGYCSVFKTIGKKFGKFDFAFIPIGAYEPRWFMEPQHVDPEQAVQIHMDVKSQHSMAVHWGTFALANEYYLEPPVKLSEALEKFALDKNNFITLEHGETYTF